jgi:hypothetical protein
MPSKSSKLFFGLFLLFAVSGQVQAQRTSPTLLNFGSIPTFTTSSLPVTLSNPGPFTLTIQSITVPAEYSQTNNCHGQIAANGSCTMTVTFAPASQGTFNGSSISIKSTANGINTSGGVTLDGTAGPALTGYINPKYVVVAVIYAPPGSNSFVDYTSSKLVSSTQNVTNTFISTTTVSASVTTPGGLFGFLGGTRTATTTNTLTEQSQNTNSVTASYTNTSSLRLFGPGTKNNCGPEAGDFIGVDHNCDLIKVWVNPVMLFTLVGPGGSNVQWNGYGYSQLDPVAPIHIVDVLVGCLNGHLAASDSRCAPALGQFQRTWAANENWPVGQGPALTTTDLSNILAANPWGKCSANAPIGSSACPTFSTPGFVLVPPQFTISNLENVPYHQGSPSTVWTVSATNSNTNGQESKTTYAQTIGIEDAFTGTNFLKGFGAKFSVMQTLSVAYEVQNSTTVSNTFTGMANITGPACNGNPCNPPYPPSPQTYGEGTEFDIFVDNFFGSFAFVPSAYN